MQAAKRKERTEPRPWPSLAVKMKNPRITGWSCQIWHTNDRCPSRTLSRSCGRAIRLTC
jgi:hypothetical protein